jgi:hypothetical protein
MCAVKLLQIAMLALSLLAAPAWSAASQQAIDNSEFGPNSTLPEPDRKLLPTVKVAKVVGWRADETPTPAAGLAVTAWARGLQHPR